jgi:hypothetical protein
MPIGRPLRDAPIGIAVRGSPRTAPTPADTVCSTYAIGEHPAAVRQHERAQLQHRPVGGWGLRFDLYEVAREKLRKNSARMEKRQAHRRGA